MKMLLIGLALLSSMSTFAAVRGDNPARLALKYDLRTTVENTFKLHIEDIEYSADGNALNVFFDRIACYRVLLKEQEINGIEKLVIIRSTKDYSCDKAYRNANR